MNLNDFKNLDPKEIGDWPVAAQMIVLFVLFAAIVGAGWYFAWQTQLDELETARGEEQRLRGQFVEKKRQAVNLEAYKQQLEEIQKQFGDLLKQLPTRSEMDQLLREINEAGVGRGLLFEEFKPGQEVKTAEFAMMPISVKLAGSYHDLAGFTDQVAKLSRIVTVDDLALTVRPNSNILEMNATVRTYRALDEAEQLEISAQEAAKKQASRKK